MRAVFGSSGKGELILDGVWRSRLADGAVKSIDSAAPTHASPTLHRSGMGASKIEIPFITGKVLNCTHLKITNKIKRLQIKFLFKTCLIKVNVD